MQLILIIQVSIALLAGELAGSLPLGTWVGAACLAAAPALVLAAGVLLASAAHRGMDRGDRRGVERFYGVMGTFDKAQLQRGFQVYKDVCSACHSLRYVAFRNLTDLG